jgi:hypothetical protein
MRRIVIVVLAGFAIGGCGSSGTGPAHSPIAPASRPATEAVTGLKAPNIRLHLDSGPVDLKPWTACYGNGCYDGSPPADLHDVGRTDAVEFSFGRVGWTFDATFRESGVSCSRQITVPITKVSRKRFRVVPAGNAGTWDVDIFGRGPGGDVITTFRWTTERSGAFPDAVASSLAVLADHDGKLDSYGVELGISDLARRPKTASAEVMVIADNGDQVSIDLGPMPKEDCYSAGHIYWTKPASAGRPATALPGARFTYVVRLTLDGVTYTGRGLWPADTNANITPAIDLVWTPGLPVYRG